MATDPKSGDAEHMPIDANYMTPNLRWGLFKKDHPGAPEPEFERVTEDDSGVPADFQFDETGSPIDGFVRCQIREVREGPVAATGFKEIPTKEKRRNGGTQDFIRNVESWMKLCTMALGRALKRAGYPDTTTDLRAFLLYEQRITEIGMLHGGPQAAGELGSGAPAAAPAGAPAPRPGDPDDEITDAILEGAAVGERDVDHAEPEPHDEPTEHDPEAFVVPEGYDEPYPEAIQGPVADLGEEGKRKLMAWLVDKGFTADRANESAAVRKQIIAEALKLKLEETGTAVPA